MDLTLYQLAEEMAVAHRFFEQNPDLDEQTMRDTLQAIELPFNQKAEAIAAYIRNLAAHADVLDQHARETLARIRTLRRRREWLLDYLLHQMQVAHMNKIQCRLFRIVVRNATQDRLVIIGDVPEAFLTQKIETVPDTQAIRAALMRGEELDFAHLERGQYLTIR